MELSRKAFVRSLLLAAAAPAAPLGLAGGQQRPAAPTATDITLDDLKAVERLAGIRFTDAERQQVLDDVRSARAGFENVRQRPIGFTTEPRTVFTPLGGGSVANARVSAKATGPTIKGVPSGDDLAFASLKDLGHLVRTRKVSPVELTELYLGRLKRLGDKLLCLVTLMEDSAMEQAHEAEREIASGHYRGPLHGIPCGIKDLYATKGVKTTWGADPYSDQVFDFDCTVVKKLHAAGAIIIAKLSMGALAMGDVWFKGTTKNPWNPKQGSSGSSAGSAAATAAGLVGFSVGTETLGSIVSPSIRCRVSGLRPTYGRISRAGAMALSYTMDKPGPICRTVEDSALVLAALCGSDPGDPSAVDRPFVWPARVDFKKLKIGFLVPPARKNDKLPTDDLVLNVLQRLGASVRPVWFDSDARALIQILDVESASAFDEFTRGPQIDKLKNSSWPQTFRTARYVPAVEYLQAQRARTLLMQSFEEQFGDLDAYVCTGGGYTLAHTNLTGHPQVVIPLADGKASSMVGRLYKEDVLATIAHEVQTRLGFTKLRPDLSVLG
ncbi:MAG TPA: amidase [Fimbriimonadaceae bacterium]|nr:amidase [Fimbriimonadaceae bacterium]